MNKLGQVGIFLGLMLFIFALIIANITAKPVKDVIEEQRSVTGLDCDNSSISTGTTLACLVTDLVLPIYILTLIGAGAGAIYWAAGIGKQ